MSRIYLSPPHMSGRELDLVSDAFRSNWIAPIGPHVDAFEREMCAKLGIEHAVALASGTAALHLALLNLGVGPGDTVLCSTLTFAATANAVLYTGATPVFVDSDEHTWNMDPDLLEEELESSVSRGERPAAVITVDIYGQCADYVRIEEICGRYEIPIVEDAAEALGSRYRGKSAGTWGNMGVLSFNGNKIITTSGGGMLLSSNPDYVSRARFLSTQARDPAPHYEHSVVGYNYRMSNLLAALGRGQLEVLDERVNRKRELNEYYRERLSRRGIEFMPTAPGCENNHWLTVILVDEKELGVSRETIRTHLQELDIESRPVWKPMHLQKAYRACRSVGGGTAAWLFDRGLCLPSGTALTDAQLEYVVDSIRAIINSKSAE